MKSCTVFLILWLTVPGWAQGEASPPNWAKLVGSEAEVTLRWPGKAKSYHVEVYTGNTTVFSGDVTENFKTLAVQAGPLYRWKVSLYQGGSYREILPLHNFSLSSRLDFPYDGKPGKDGVGLAGQSSHRPLGTMDTTPAGGADGAPGANGGPGHDVRVSLKKSGDFLEVTLETGVNKQKFLLCASSSPLVISSLGGRGGNGAPGGNGTQGWYRPASANDPGYSAAPGRGGRGGAGGDGGRGGNVKVSSQGVEPARYIQVRLDGGEGGRGGAGGQAGQPAQVPAVMMTPGTYNPTQYGPAPSGQPGPDGHPGARGQATGL